jgi:hypothetical protein
MVRQEDLDAAQRSYDEALREQQDYERNPAEWSGFESLTTEGRKILNLNAAHFDRLEAHRRRVESAHRNLVATRQRFLEGR